MLTGSLMGANNKLKLLGKEKHEGSILEISNEFG
jgi:hypothetical protein